MQPAISSLRLRTQNFLHAQTSASMKALALAAIRFYKRFISPYKGFRCAYHVHTGRSSCSLFGYRAIQRFGILHGFLILRKRLNNCGVAHRRHYSRKLVWNKQAGFCDLSCDLPCDSDFGSAACDILSNCGSPCDCGDWWSSRQKRTDDQKVYLPPYRKSRRLFD